MFHRTFGDAQWHVFFQRILREACVLSTTIYPPPRIILTTDAAQTQKPARYEKTRDEFRVRTDLFNHYGNAYERTHGTEAVERQLATHAFTLARWRLHALRVSVVKRNRTTIGIGRIPIPIGLKRSILSDDILRGSGSDALGENGVDARVTGIVAVFFIYDQNDIEAARAFLST